MALAFGAAAAAQSRAALTKQGSVLGRSNLRRSSITGGTAGASDASNAEDTSAVGTSGDGAALGSLNGSAAAETAEIAPGLRSFSRVGGALQRR